MLAPRDFQPRDYYRGRPIGGGGNFLPTYGAIHPMLSAGPTGAGAPAPVPYVPPAAPAPISPLLAMSMQQQMGAAQPQASGMPSPVGMGGMPQGQPMSSGGQNQNFIPPIQATPFNFQGGSPMLPIGGMWNQVAQQMAGPGFMKPGTSALIAGYNPPNAQQPASHGAQLGLSNLGNLGVINSLYSPLSVTRA